MRIDSLLDRLVDKICALDSNNKQLKAENARLRELARHLYTCLTRPKVYDGTLCPYYDGHNCNHVTCGFKRRMRELGIEEES